MLTALQSTLASTRVIYYQIIIFSFNIVVLTWCSTAGVTGSGTSIGFVESPTETRYFLIQAISLQNTVHNCSSSYIYSNQWYFLNSKQAAKLNINNDKYFTASTAADSSKTTCCSRDVPDVSFHNQTGMENDVNIVKFGQARFMRKLLCSHIIISNI